MDFVSLGCCAFAFLLYYNTLDAGFVYDDRRAVLNNPDILPDADWFSVFLNDFWGTPLTDSGSHGSYRPLCVLSFRLNHLLGGFQPWGYHLVNVLLHCLATWLVVRVARRIFPAKCAPVGSAVAGLVFASHPVHTEAVAGVVGRADLAACVLYLLSFLAYATHIKYRDSPCLTGRLMRSLNGGSRSPESSADHCICCDQLARKTLALATSGIARRVDVENGSPRNRSKNMNRYHNFVVNLQNHSWSNCSWTHSTAKQMPAIKNHCNHSIFGLFNLSNASNGRCWLSLAEPSSGMTLCAKRRMVQWLALVACVASAAFAVLCKETGITVLAVCIVYDLVHAASGGKISREQRRSLLVLAVTTLVMLILRLQLTEGQTPKFSTADNPTARSPSLLTRLLTFTYLPAFNFRLLLAPTILSFDWSMDSIPRINSLLDSRNLTAAVFYVFFAQLVRRSVQKTLEHQMAGKGDSNFKKPLRMMKRKIYDQAAAFVQNQVLCQCPVCHHGVSEHHSVSCRTTNNNNSMTPVSCVCQPTKVPASRTFSCTKEKTRTFHAAILAALAFLAFPFLPATNALFYVGFVVAERILYIPSVGYCLLLGLSAGWFARTNRHQRLVCGVCVFVLVAFGARTVLRNRDWVNEESLYRSAIPVNPPKAYGNLGSVLSSQGRTEEAEWVFRKALEFRSNMADVHYNLGNLLQGKQKYEEAIQSYQKAIHFRPSLALAYVNLGATLVAAGRCQEAVTVLRQGSRLDGSGLKDRRTHETARVSALLQLGALYTDQGRLQRALAAYREALHTMPNYYPPQGVYNLLGETLSRLQQFEEAERWYQAALQAQPDHVPAHITYGKLLAKNGSRIVEAEHWFRKAQRLAPSDPSVYHHYGEFLAGLGRHAEAANQYTRAAELRPSDYELVTAAATALRQAGRKIDAESWYRHAVNLRPQDARGHTNLGAMLHLNGKYRQAADSYREALKLQPDDVTTLTNLHKLYSAMS